MPLTNIKMAKKFPKKDNRYFQVQVNDNFAGYTFDLSSFYILSVKIFRIMTTFFSEFKTIHLHPIKENFLNSFAHKFFLLKINSFILFAFFCLSSLQAQTLEMIQPEKVGLDSKRLQYADEAIMNAIANKEIPGAVLAVVKEDKLAYLKAYGNKQLEPVVEKMDVNTVFDLASVTKPVATATSAMILIEQGKLRLQDKVSMYIPDFQGWQSADGKKRKDIRVIDLMTHTSGLPSYAPVEELQKQFGSPNPDALIKYISTCRRDFEPETNFQYSCLNYITLQRIIEIISKQNLRDFAKTNIFDVLGMIHTDFQPTGETLSRVAPTERQKDGTFLKGVVHDPLARIMNGGISGNAGLFSDANDLAVFVAALQNDGIINGKRILSPLGVKALRTLPIGFEKFGRTLGWDISSEYASNKGDLLSPNTYGHTGYTGTSIVIDPDNHVAIILLTNRVHPVDKGNVNRLRAIVANAVAASIIQLNLPEIKALIETKRPYSDYYYQRCEQFEKEKPITSDDIVMLGNSITEGGGDWSKQLDFPNVINRGISGDILMGVYDRLNQILPGKPQKIFLMIGINDVSHNLTSDSIVKNIRLIAKKIHTESPQTELYIQSLLPINESFNRYKNLTGKTNQVVEINQKLKQLCDNEGIKFVNLFPLFVEKGTIILRSELTNDGLHLNEAGYSIWVKKLRQYIH